MATLTLNGGALVCTRPRPCWPQWDARERPWVLNVLRSDDWSGFAPVVAEFERAFAQCHGAAFGTATVNGAQALVAALTAASISSGDEVTVPLPLTSPQHQRCGWLAPPRCSSISETNTRRFDTAAVEGVQPRPAIPSLSTGMPCPVRHSHAPERPRMLGRHSARRFGCRKGAKMPDRTDCTPVHLCAFGLTFSRNAARICNHRNELRYVASS
ncbi:MAG: DegT/DnrJ/EryC1/StrS family aminotransferase [Roseiflexus sp.]|nr:DegT/DnrJ/EryC1/StrS family aminotransferase [Roseiflexus sp.]MCS7287770.1 DegT/DnrJ/EryC1/StrS family aminotransferase [Roseiflexus sp.]MDW8147586.1 DegT/DnrJ/EryC1/StrS family aminotransferase [Roseiflexaceae bacterium]